ncbi:Molybdenum cofactor biosynthesis protein C [Sugiyamaella lignohabitans]|uniref:cyclic pyranopterin monophosphate synthase n=1 Tax=Sugiyamaella lignohabitans TaxID=796027 RepID=A0A167CET9_9ASCO|nr:Molybdenum cofactor biosynthesis protein C [Sugiyamaella lignohabitans]ANB11596.1 Molybdenum cofactor biosynthesis protein C [Sugiyamaella lignohabitans]
MPFNNPARQLGSLRLFSTTRTTSDLTHVDSSGSAHMVDISEKKETRRSATAKGVIRFSNDQVATLIRNNQLKKGDVLSVARIAGIMAVKLTPNIIPLCHPIMVTKIKNNLVVCHSDNSVEVTCTVECFGKTGVEMEAMTGAMASLTTVYDMCKAVDKHMVISQVYISEKRGGKADFTFDPANDSTADSSRQ